MSKIGLYKDWDININQSENENRRDEERRDKVAAEKDVVFAISSDQKLNLESE